MTDDFHSIRRVQPITAETISVIWQLSKISARMMDGHFAGARITLIDSL